MASARWYVGNLYVLDRHYVFDTLIQLYLLERPARSFAQDLSSFSDSFLLCPCTFLTHWLYSSISMSMHVQEQAQITGAYFFGYMFSMIPAGFLAQAIGGHKTLAGSLLGIGILLCAVPGAANVGAPLMSVTLCLIGVSSGPLSPARLVMLSKWIPKEESAEALTIIKNGGRILFLTDKVWHYLVACAQIAWYMHLKWCCAISEVIQHCDYFAQIRKSYWENFRSANGSCGGRRFRLEGSLLLARCINADLLGHLDHPTLRRS